MAEHEGKGADEHAHLAMEALHAAKALATVLLDETIADAVMDHVRQRHEVLQRIREDDRARAGAAAAMGRRAGLVQVDVHGVDAERWAERRVGKRCDSRGRSRWWRI